MNNIKLGTLALLAVCFGSFGSASAQSRRHDLMDARAARAAIRRLEKDRRKAVRTHNFGKIAQDDRLIAADRYFIKMDEIKARRAKD